MHHTSVTGFAMCRRESGPVRGKVGIGGMTCQTNRQKPASRDNHGHLSCRDWLCVASNTPYIASQEQWSRIGATGIHPQEETRSDTSGYFTARTGP